MKSKNNLIKGLALLVLTFSTFSSSCSKNQYSAQKTAKAVEEVKQEDELDFAGYKLYSEELESELCEKEQYISELEKEREELKESLRRAKLGRSKALFERNLVARFYAKIGFNMSNKIMELRKELDNYKNKRIPNDYSEEIERLKIDTERKIHEAENIRLQTENLKLRREMDK